MHVRIATESDVAEMHRVRMSVRENRLADPTRVKPADYLPRLTTQGRGWVAEVDGRIAGFAVADVARSNVWALFVAPELERQGVGRRLHDVMMQWVFDAGVERMRLSTDPGTRAERFYQAAGWQYAGTEPNGEVRFEISREQWRSPHG
jgi:GNAT superfamily N-acetyltransferase